MRKALGWLLAIIIIGWALNHRAHASHMVTQAGNLLATMSNAVGNVFGKLGG